MTPTSDPRVLVVGAGPAGLAVASALGCHGLAGDLEVVDPAGGWLDADGRPTVQLADGSVRRPDRVVLATNRRRAQLPACVDLLVGRDPRVATGESAHVADTPPGGHVVVVGGGLSAAHLALGAVARGAWVTLLTRRRLRVRRFDTHPSWLGPRKRGPFEIEPDPRVRRRMIDHARGGGSVPHPVRRRLDDAVADGRLGLCERIELTDVEAGDDALFLWTSNGQRLRADRLWLATGGAVDVDHDPLCRPLRAPRPVPVAGGMVDLDPDLSWPGTRVHLVGAAASLVLGPTAGNLVGQRRAASRVLAAVRGADPGRRRPDRHRRRRLPDHPRPRAATGGDHVTAPSPAGAVHDAIAVVTCWLDDDRATATPLAAAAVDRDPTGFLEALGGLITVIADVCADAEVHVPAIVRDVALGVAQAEAEHPAGRDRPARRTDRARGPDDEPGPASGTSP